MASSRIFVTATKGIEAFEALRSNAAFRSSDFTTFSQRERKDYFTDKIRDFLQLLAGSQKEMINMIDFMLTESEKIQLSPCKEV